MSILNYVSDLFIIKADDMFKVETYDLNLDKKSGDESYNLFDISLIYDETSKTFGIPYECYFEWLFETDKKAMRYIKKLVNKGADDIDIIRDLDSLGYNWVDSFQKYVDENFSENLKYTWF